ncbi:ankyrin repeat-containing domain protein [Rhexocercosporidium sp. MPI-PUGE-AT-0058]|nr:ankyrin repeat-containing domain protein [Rhexocercosporidium sp. MPI-PUGE-AT-0058]
MDPLGATASVLTLLDVAIKTTKLINRLVKEYQNTHAELTRLKHKVEGLKSQIVLLRLLEETVGSDVFELGGSDVTTTLDGVIRESMSVLSEICSHFEDQCLVSALGKRKRLKWALLDSSRIRQWDGTLHQQSGELGNILLLLNLRSSSLLHSKVEKWKPCIQPTISAPNLHTQVRLLRALYYFGDWAIIPFVSKIHGSFSTTRKGKQYMYNLSLRLQALFCLKVLSIDLKLRQHSLFSMSSTYFGMDLKIRTLVKEDSEVMEASKRGDTEAVWALFQAGKASVHDVTSENRSPLRYAIESGSSDLIRYLINNGADVNEYCGLMQTNLIQCAFAFSQIEIARILISNGTEIHHINAAGWTPAFHIFGTMPNPTLKSSHESLEILSSASFTDFDTQDVEGWTCMHRAAAYGRADDIKLLLKLNASAAIQTVKVCWTPIFCAVHFGNISTFDELRRLHANFLTLRDVRRWSLLHVAVNAKQGGMIEHLIGLGADPHARSLATQFLVPVALKGRSATPGDIALLRGREVVNRYVGALVKCGHDAHLSRDTPESETEIFWPAEEKL